MAKIKYTATCADGTVVTRKSDRTYSHYWVVTGSPSQARLDSMVSNGWVVEGELGVREQIRSGWARTRVLAEKAANSTVNMFTKHGSFVDVRVEIVAGVAS